MRNRVFLRVAFGTVLSFFVGIGDIASTVMAASPAQSFDEKAAAEFYRGKTVRVVVGFAPGGGYDVAARVLGRHLGKHIPGNPTVIVENRPGAGSLVTANLAYKTLPQDGTFVASFHPQLILQQLLGREGIEFDAARYNWLGNLTAGRHVCVVHRDTGVKHIRQVMGPGAVVINMGAEAPGTGITDATAIMRAALGLSFRMIYGYAGAAPVASAIQRREVDGMCISWEALTTVHADFFEPQRIVNVLVMAGSTVPEHPWLENTEAADKVATTQDPRDLIRAGQAPEALAFPFAVGPGVPPGRVAALRSAFEKTVADPSFVADWDKTKRPLVANNGEKVTGIVRDVLGAKPELVARLTDALKQREGP
jgi:tripartite-type tricarboxylate transporter receptor subunit TctC